MRNTCRWKKALLCALLEKMGQQYKVTFKRSGIEAVWDGSHGNLLELAESLGIPIPFSCRSGIDEVCATPVLEGEVDQGNAAIEPPEGMCLVCIGVPKSDVVLDA